MKKMFIVAIIVSTALVAACGKKKAPAAPAGGDMGSAAPAGDMGSGSDATTPPADGAAGSGSAM
ncbi:MAG: hypothetical protein H0T79_10695 [Deltaproteobacteria bacterium]|nr:hypothetical protein [Deltaproteobacteria bacterium]